MGRCASGDDAWVAFCLGFLLGSTEVGNKVRPLWFSYARGAAEPCSSFVASGGRCRCKSPTDFECLMDVGGGSW